MRRAPNRANATDHISNTAGKRAIRAAEHIFSPVNRLEETKLSIIQTCCF